MQSRALKSRNIPAHAYSFSAGILLTVTMAGLHFFQEDQRLTQVCLVAVAGCVAHGMYDLYQEGRLGKALGLPFFKQHAAKISRYAHDLFESDSCWDFSTQNNKRSN